MVTAAYYRTEARRWRERASTAMNQESADQWRKLARDYEALADEVEARPVVQAAPVQQPLQQQQSKAEPKE